MKRTLIVAAVSVALLTSGCATQTAPLVPPGEDRAKLIEAIAQHGQITTEQDPVAAYTPDLATRAVVGTIKLTGKLAATALVGCLVVGLAFCHTGGQSVGGNGIFDWLGHVWTED